MADLTVQPIDSRSDGCPVLTKMRAVPVQKGTNPWLNWQLRDGIGNPLNISDLICTDSETSEDADCEGGQVIFRFGDAIAPDIIQQVIGEVVHESPAEVRVKLPNSLTDEAGIWRFQVAVTNKDGEIGVMNDGLMSVERGFFGNTEKLYGPPTLEEIRMEIRDTAVENIRLDDFEFSDAEIIRAIVKPIDEWNERPPPLRPAMTANNFPFRQHWMKAIVAELLTTAAYYYRRNKTKITAAGVTDQALDRDQDYEAKASQLRQEWVDFMIHKKVELNARMAFGSHNSGWY